MRITQIRDDGRVNTLRTLKIEQLVEQMKVETKAQLVSGMREALPYIFPGDKNDYVQKVPKLLPAAAFVRKNGVMTMDEYNGVVMLQVNNLSGPMEADEVKERVKEFPQTYLAFTGSSGKSVKIWVRFTYPDDLLPGNREQAELFHAHAYRLAVKFYQPQLPFDIDLKEPSLEQYCRLTFDPELYFNPEAMPVYMKQPMAMPGETTYREQVKAETSPLQRLVPGYESYKALSVLFEAAFARALDEQHGYQPGDDIHSLLVYQPIEEFLYDLPRWDGKDHIGDLAKRVPCNNPHWAQLFRRWFLSMIAHWRGLGKNHANSTSPILVGPQAYRKSTFCRLILPPCLQAYYTDSIDFSRKRDAELYLNRFLLINMDEFDQIGINQQPFLKHIMQKPVVNTRRPNASAVEELRRYASFIGTSNHKDLLTDTSGSRRYIGVEVTGVIDVVRPVDYEQLYAQAMAALYHNERYWFDEKEEAIMTEANQEFEQSPLIEQLFLVYYRVADDEEEGEWILAADILQRIQKASKMKFSSGQVNYFGRILQRLGVKSYRKTRGVYYHVVAVAQKEIQGNCERLTGRKTL